MQPTKGFEPVAQARSLLRRSRQGALATLMDGTGAPYCSLVRLASHPDGSPILLISRLALHTRNLLADTRVSLLLNDHSDGDPLARSRIMLSGNALAAPPGDVSLLRRRYLSVCPSAELFVDFSDFGFFGITLQAIHLVAGFGRIVDLTPEQVLTDLTGAASLIEAEERAIENMNADHAEALNLFATQLLGAVPGSWRCTGLDPDGIDLQGGLTSLRLDFPRRVATPAELRKMLIELAAQARGLTC